MYAFTIASCIGEKRLMFHLDIILAICDVEGNFVVVKVSSAAEIIFPIALLTHTQQAYQYTNLLSCMLLAA